MQRNYVVTSVLEYKYYEYVFFNSGQICNCKYYKCVAN